MNATARCGPPQIWWTRKTSEAGYGSASARDEVFLTLCEEATNSADQFRAPRVLLFEARASSNHWSRCCTRISASSARTAMRHGTVASVSDPHEIANVLGEP